MAVFRGVAFIISNGQSISIFDPTFRFIGDGEVLRRASDHLVLMPVVAIFFVMMSYTIIGRNIYAIGGNPVVASLAGLAMSAATRSASSMLSGATAGLAGMLLAARARDPASPFPGPTVSNWRRSPRRSSAGAL